MLYSLESCGSLFGCFFQEYLESHPTRNCLFVNVFRTPALALRERFAGKKMKTYVSAGWFRLVLLYFLVIAVVVGGGGGGGGGGCSYP